MNIDHMNKEDRIKAIILQKMQTRYITDTNLPTTSRLALSKSCDRRLAQLFDHYRATAELDDLLPLPMRDER